MEKNQSYDNWFGFLIFFILVLVTGLAEFFFYQWKKVQSKIIVDTEEFNLDPYEIAFLAGGQKRATNAAIAKGVNRKNIGIARSSIVGFLRW